MDDTSRLVIDPTETSDELSRFTDSYASFNRVINSLQRKYIDLQEEFTAQNEKLVEANKRLVRLTEKNITVTEFLNGILNSISAGVIAVDQNGRITHFNPAASVILGIPRREPLGKHYRDVVPPGNPIEANALRAAETGSAVDSVEKHMALSDGARLQLSVSTAILRDNDGQPVGAVEVFQDLTKIKRMEQEIARLNTLAALGEMAATIAHEVRNPLAGIGGFAALLERDLGDDDPRKKLVQKIMRGTNSLNETVETLLAYTRSEEINKTQVDFTGFIESAIDQFKIDNQTRLENIKFVLEACDTPSKEPITLCMDKLLFRQILFNIFSNSIDACQRQGEIRIQVRKLPRQTALAKYADKLMLGIDQTAVETIISDTGPGISPEHLDKIFAPFFTTKRDGNGLGLAVAWKIMKAHSGEVWAENAEGGKGALFCLLMPTQINGTFMEQ